MSACQVSALQSGPRPCGADRDMAGVTAAPANAATHRCCGEVACGGLGIGADLRDPGAGADDGTDDRQRALQQPTAGLAGMHQARHALQLSVLPVTVAVHNLRIAADRRKQQQATGLVCRTSACGRHGGLSDRQKLALNTMEPTTAPTLASTKSRPLASWRCCAERVSDGSRFDKLELKP